jgi:hypothetical protein
LTTPEGFVDKKVTILKRELSIDSRLKFGDEEIPGVQTVMVTPFKNNEEIHLSIIMDADQVQVENMPEPDDGLGKFMEEAEGSTA